MALTLAGSLSSLPFISIGVSLLFSLRRPEVDKTLNTFNYMPSKLATDWRVAALQ